MKIEETYTWRQIKREKNKQKMSLSVPSRTRVIYLEFRGFNDLNVVFFKACCVIFHGRDVSVLMSVWLISCVRLEAAFVPAKVEVMHYEWGDRQPAMQSLNTVQT